MLLQQGYHLLWHQANGEYDLEQHGDEIRYIARGYFAPMYNSCEHIRQTIHKALRFISEMVGNEYRPQSLVAGSRDAENQNFLATEGGIHVRQGQIWSRHGLVRADSVA
jgi:hypothetical protein